MEVAAAIISLHVISSDFLFSFFSFRLIDLFLFLLYQLLGYLLKCFNSLFVAPFKVYVGPGCNNLKAVEIFFYHSQKSNTSECIPQGV